MLPIGNMAFVPAVTVGASNPALADS